ncbi:tRNA (carboxymethyluridine(34)-5-O)-methyltransferase [Grifola frondosa]|uniref:tRNA (Carboxymethyluridine(34)-5-O)-methyltransferase n=1 Tax=Grifola frondosa TaxID=5627 RepID=A0A1C7MDS4_GRIFR|nr:tRNA (carboxymethyluridine(34)-5-O)-methyltransferase [Grifola frondosa]
MPAAKAVTATVVSDDPQMYEDEHVHAVYDGIAPHFSSTRYKPWPIIANFLSSLPTGWVGVDSGTGNGKYLPLPLERPGSVWTIGLDRSRNLLEIARMAGGEGTVCREVVWGDVLGRPWRDGAFDYAISIATIHHLATHARRKTAVQRLLKCISPSHGRALVYVWAIEQDELSKRSTDTSGRGQDVFVPWVLAPQSAPQSKTRTKAKGNQSQAPGDLLLVPEEQVGAGDSTSKVVNRYYHMFAKGELSDMVSEAARDMGLIVGTPPDEGARHGVRGVEIVQDGWERSNYYVELRCWER